MCDGHFSFVTSIYPIDYIYHYFNYNSQMPNDLALDPLTGDLDVKNLDLYVIQGAERVRQQLTVKLRLWTTEWFLDTEFGTPYLEEILGKQISLAGSVAALKRSIMEVADVDKITSFNTQFDRKTRKLTIVFECSTPFGIIRVTQ